MIQLEKRTANVTNLNFQPEKAGDELAERVDLNLALLLNEAELDSIVETRWQDASKVLFDDKGEPLFTHIDTFTVDLKVEGNVQLGRVNGKKMLEFDTGLMKKISIEPMIGRKATMKCQVRIDPTGHLEELGRMRIDERAQFAFTSSADPERASKNKNQEELEV